MTDEATPTTDAVSTTESLSDPESLRDRDDVPFSEETMMHDSADHCAVGIDGRAVVGVTNEAGEILLAVHRDTSTPVLPHGRVEPGDDWAAVGRRAVEESTGVAVEIDGPELVRDIDHFVEGTEERHTTSYNVLFRASPVADETDADGPGVADDDGWDAEWFDEVPENAPGGLLEDDIRLFVD